MSARTLLLAGPALATALACAPRPAPPSQVLGFRALLRQAGIARGDTACVSVAARAGEADPAAPVLAALRDSVPTLLPISGCQAGAGRTQDLGLVRLRAVRVRGDTLEVDGETVAEHLSRYVCYVDRRSGSPLGACRLAWHQ